MLTIAQVQAIIGLLMAFGLGQPTLGTVQADLMQDTATATQAAPQDQIVPVDTAPSFVAPASTGVAQPTTATSTPTAPATIVVFNAGSYLDGVNAQHYAAPAGTTLGSASDGEFITVGAIVYNQNGLVDCTQIVTASTSDPTQDKTWYSTPNRDANGNCYYAYQYLFTWAGAHQVEFLATQSPAFNDAASTTLTMTAQ